MIVERAGKRYNVVDDAQTASWNFWDQHFAGDWEEPTRLIIEQFCKPDLDYVDIGAWVGPTVLWAAPLSRKVVAVEPDPMAAKSLRVNTKACSNVTVLEAAAAPETGRMALETWGDWGDSMSSLIIRKPGMTNLKTVMTMTLPDIWELNRIGDVSLIKIDIEGGEALLLPAAVDFLHELDCPILLSTHYQWLNDREAIALRDAVYTFHVTVVAQQEWLLS